jgi:hypothetical protein
MPKKRFDAEQIGGPSPQAPANQTNQVNNNWSYWDLGISRAPNDNEGSRCMSDKWYEALVPIMKNR